MTFFYDLNKRLATIADTPQTKQLNEGAVAEADYSAKAARAGKDIGKPGKAFAQIAKSAGERYGSKERGEKVAGAVLAKLRKGGVKEADVGEGNAFAKAVVDAKKDGIQPGEKIKVGGKEYPVKEADMDESALQAYLGKKKYGEKGMKALQKAGRDGASEKTMDKIRDQHDKMDEGWDDMLAAVDKRREMKPGEKVQGAKGEIEKTATGIRHTRRYDAKTGETETGDDAGSEPQKRGRGRPKGTGKSMGAKGPSGKSKLMTREGEDDPAEKGEYDREGDMALDDIDTIESAANELQAIIDADENLPEWVQSKINKAMDYLDTARDYMKAQGNDPEPVAEKAVSKAQQRFMGMAHAMQKGEKIPGASKELKKVAKGMKKGDVKDFAKTKHEGLPEKKKKQETDESTTAGSVATAPTSGKSKGGFSFGKGIYDSYNREVEDMIAESINISMNANSDGGEMGGGTRSLTVTATDEDAAKLAALLKMAGLGSGDHEQMDEAYGDTQATENQPDYPTNQEQAQDNFEYSGGLNKPKTTVAGDGQTTVPVTAVQMREQQDTDLAEELRRMREIAGIREGKKPDFVDLDKDGDRKESMKKAADDAKKHQDDKEVKESILSMTNLWKQYQG